MTICTHCGVELDEGWTVCPLCGWNPEKSGKENPQAANNPSEIIRMHKNENRKHLWELSGIIAFSGIAVCTLVDLLLSGKLEWSPLSDVIILAAWLVLTLALFGHRKTGLFLPGLLVTILSALWVADIITGGADWFFPVGLPIAMAACLAVGLFFVLYKTAGLRGLNFIASCLIVAAGFCIATELILDHYLHEAIRLRWSLIVAVSILPVTLIFLFYHYRLKKGNHLDSLFHI